MTPYETDIAAWAEQNAELIRARRWQEVDAEHVLEEIEALGNDRRSARDSHVVRVMEHLLKLRYVTGEQTLRYNVESWRGSGALHRREALRVLRRNPSLRPELNTELLADLYADARAIFVDCQFEHAQTPPEQCPFTWQEILGEPVRPAAAARP